MNRRRFLRDTLLGAIAAATLPRMALAAPVDGGRAAAFARGLRSEPWLVGWRNAAQMAFEPTVAKLEGRIPKDLGGVLYRNGPAWFERAGFRYKHWFDGDGMLHAWRIDQRGVSHRARMVGTPKFEREHAAGRFLLPAAGSTIPDPIAVRNNDDMNTANTAVIEHAGRLLALWEGGSATALSPADLSTLGPVNFSPELTAAPFSAHPLVERDGSLWNVGGLAMLGASGVLVWNIAADGTLRKHAVVADESGPGYVHSFSMTQRHLVVMLEPYTHGGEGKSLFERMQYDPRVPCRVVVIPKDALDQPQWFEVEHAAVYHWADATEHAGIIDVRGVRHHDLAQARAPLAGAMRGVRDPDGIATELVSLRIDLTQKTARWVGRGHRGGEFPVFDERGARASRGAVYLTTGSGKQEAPYANSISAVDAEGRVRTHRYGTRIMVEEHRFVPRPGSDKVDDGWLVGTVLDFEKQRTGLSILDACQVEDGPLAQAWLPYAMPLGFHGWFSMK